MPRHPIVDFTKIEKKLEVIEDNSNYLVNETDDKIDDIQKVVEALKKEPSKEPSKDPSKDPSKVSTLPSKEPSNREDNIEDLKPSKEPSKVSTLPSKDDEFKELTANQQKVVKYIKNNPNQSQKEISEALNMDRSTLSKVLKFLIDEKYIIKNEEDTYV